MSKRPPKKSDNRILYWLGAGALVLLAGIIALIFVARKPAQGPADPERTLLLVYDGANPAGTLSAAVIEESRSNASLAAYSFPPPEGMKSGVAAQEVRKVQSDFAALVKRQVHHRVYLPYSVVSTLVDAAGGIDVDGKALTGDQAVAVIRESKGDRSVSVLLALGDAVGRRGVNMSVSQGLGLARQVETDLDLMGMPDVLGRWNGYSAPKVEKVADLETLSRILLADPPAPR